MVTFEPPVVRTQAASAPLEPAGGADLQTESLASRVAKLALGIDERQLVSVAGAGAGAALQPKALLAVLIYSYAAGIFSSEAIVEQMQEDTHFRVLCGDDYPDWHQLRRFRRLNRPLIRHCLETLLAPVPVRGSDLAQSSSLWAPERRAAPGGWEPGSQTAIAQEVSRRLNRAAQLDSITLDE